MKPDLTIEYFRKEFCEFRKLLQDRFAWKLEEDLESRADKGIKGLTYVYLNLTGTSEELEQAEILMNTAMTELSMRRPHALTMGLC